MSLGRLLDFIRLPTRTELFDVDDTHSNQQS